MVEIREVILVEGRYDKNALSQVVQATILETGGFGIFKDPEKRLLLRTLAEKRGLIVLTDSDGAGFVIRNHIRGCVDKKYVKHAYIPDIYGKERRKSTRSKEGKLGVEGMPPDLLLDCLLKAGATVVGETGIPKQGKAITKADFFALGLTGRDGSTALRAALQKKLDLPERLTPNGLLEILNLLMSREELEAHLKELQ